MAKLIPGKVRSQGSLLYEAGKVSLQEVKEKYLYFRVEEESLRYSLDDDAVFCSCAFFQKKKFCTHLAAVEAYLKNDDSGKLLLQVLKKMPLQQRKLRRRSLLEVCFRPGPSKNRKERDPLCLISRWAGGRILWSILVDPSHSSLAR